MKREISVLLLGAAAAWLLTGCASWWGGEDASAPATDERAPASVKSNRPKTITIDNRSTSPDPLFGADDAAGPDLAKNEFAAEARLGGDQAIRSNRRNGDPWYGTANASEGSLWNDTTNDNFYFSKNVSRKVGDLIVAKFDNDVNDSLNAKIGALIEKNTPKPTPAQAAAVAGVEQAAGDAKIDGTRKPSAEDALKKAGNQATKAGVNTAVDQAKDKALDAILDRKEKFVDVEDMTLRIVQALPRGTFKVEGSRKVLIRLAPYTLKYSGIVRTEDISPTSEVASAKILESKMELTR